MADEPTEGAVELELGGQKVVVNEQLAEALKKQREQDEKALKDYQQRLEQQVSEWQNNFQAQLQPAQQQPQTPQEADFWSDPDNYLNQRFKKFEEKFDSKISEKEKALNAQITEEKLWDDFYRNHKDLKRDKDDFLVRAILQRDQQDIAQIAKTDLNKAMNELADRTKKFIVDNLGKKKEEKEEVILESPQASPEAMFNQAPSEEKIEGTLSDIIRQRHRDRRKSKSKQA